MNRKNELAETFRLVQGYLRSSESVVTNVYQSDEYNDYPSFYHFVTKYIPRRGWVEDDLLANGLSFNKEEAFIKAVMETIERCNLSNFEERDLKHGSYFDLRTKANVINPELFRAVSDSQVKNKKYKDFVFNEKSGFYWTKVNNLKGEGLLIPAQMIHFLHNRVKNEPIIKLPDSTGAAAGMSHEQALYAAICELTERDAYSITYYNKIGPKSLSLETITNKKLRQLISYLRRFYFDVRIYDITLDIKIPVFFCVLIDETDEGPRINVGAKCDVDVEVAIEGSIMESLQGIGATRDMLYMKKNLGRVDFGKIGKSIKPIIERILFWAEAPVEKINFLNTGEMVDYQSYDRRNWESYDQKLDQVLSCLAEAGFGEVYWKDTSTKENKKFDIHTLKAIIPGLVPLSLNGDYPYYKNPRLYKIPVACGLRNRELSESELNVYPHPLP